MRKLAIGAVVGVVMLVTAAVALAVTNTVTYTSTIKQKTKPTATKPANVAYTGEINISTTDNTQPDIAPLTELFIAKPLILNSTHFKSCEVKDIDGKNTVPAKCKAAIVGNGTAVAKIGNPGKPPTITQNLTVTAYNGHKGKQLFLVVNGSSPVRVTNRVIPGTITKGSGAFGSKIAFKIPPDLQQQLGLAISLTHFQVTLLLTKTATVKSVKVTYLQLKSCPKSKRLPTSATVHFNNDDNSPGGPVVTNNGVMACK